MNKTCGYGNCTLNAIKRYNGKCLKHRGLVFVPTLVTEPSPFVVETPAENLDDVVKQAIMQSLNQQNVFVPQRIVPVTFELANICAPTSVPEYIAGIQGLTRTEHENKDCKTIELKLGTFNILSNLNASAAEFATWGGKDINLNFKYRGPKLINVLKEMMKECEILVTQDNDMFFKILRELQKQNQDIAGIYFLEKDKKNAYELFDMFISKFRETHGDFVTKKQEVQNSENYKKMNPGMSSREAPPLPREMPPTKQEGLPPPQPSMGRRHSVSSSSSSSTSSSATSSSSGSPFTQSLEQSQRPQTVERQLPFETASGPQSEHETDDKEPELESEPKEPEFESEFRMPKGQSGPEKYVLESMVLKQYYPDAYESFESFCGEYGKAYASYYNAKEDQPYISSVGVGVYFNAKKVEFLKVEVEKNQIDAFDVKEFKIFETKDSVFNCKFKKSAAVFSLDSRFNDTKKDNIIVCQSTHNIKDIKLPDSKNYVNVVDDITKNMGMCIVRRSAVQTKDRILIKPELVQKIGMFADLNQFGFQRQNMKQEMITKLLHISFYTDDDNENRDISKNLQPSIASETEYVVLSDKELIELNPALQQIFPNFNAPSIHVPQMVHLMMKNCAV